MSYMFDAAGWTAALLAIFAFQSKTMVPLRTAATFATAFGFVYAASKHAYPNMAVNGVLFVLNLRRLIEMRRLVADARVADERPSGFEWLKPFMRRVEFPAGHVLFKRGDVGEEAYLLGSGEVFVPEHDGLAKAGDMIGEIGLLTGGHKRTASAICQTPVRAWAASYRELEALCLQNPEFCWHLTRIIVRRYEENLGKAGAG